MPAEADLLLDAACMGGDRALCMGLQTILRDLVAGQSELLPRLAAPVQLHEAPLGRLGGLKPDAQGQIDLMCQGLWPIMAGARILTLCEGGDLATARATDARLLRLERLSHDQRQAFLAARRYLMTRLLICQLAQVERGDEPQNTVSLEVIARSHGEGLRKALKDAGAMAPLIRDCLRKRER